MTTNSASPHIIHPHMGLNDARFGMTPDEVAAVAGPADAVEHDSILELTTERRGGSEYTFEDGVLTEIFVFKPGRGKAIRERLAGAGYIPAHFDTVDVLDPAGFATLTERERTQEGRGNTGVLFPDLGLFIAGFRKRVPEGAYVAIFAPSRLSEFESWLEV